MTELTPEEIQAQIDALQAQLPQQMHRRDYRRDVQSNMTVCGLVVGDEFVTNLTDETTCSLCKELQFRRDEPEMPIPGEANQKEERYGD